MDEKVTRIKKGAIFGLGIFLVLWLVLGGFWASGNSLAGTNTKVYSNGHMQTGKMDMNVMMSMMSQNKDMSNHMDDEMLSICNAMMSSNMMDHMTHEHEEKCSSMMEDMHQEGMRKRNGNNAKDSTDGGLLGCCVALG